MSLETPKDIFIQDSVVGSEELDFDLGVDDLLQKLDQEVKIKVGGVAIQEVDAPEELLDDSDEHSGEE